MISQYLNAAVEGGAISDEERSAYSLGFRDACEAMRSDEVYYEICGAKQTLAAVVVEAANYVEGLKL